MKVAVVGGGWAGLAAAVEAVRLGHSTSLFEMAATLGGRARDVDVGGRTFDNGQHILIGAYTATLELMKNVGVDPNIALRRLPLQVTYPDGSGLVMQAGAPVPAFFKAVARYRGWSLLERASLLMAATRWSMMRFRCDASWTVARLTQTLSPTVRSEFIDPLCVAALNTPSGKASASVFLRVLKDALFSGPGSADLLLPTSGLGSLLPSPAADWLTRNGASLRVGRRVNDITASRTPDATGWLVDGERFDEVVLACSATEAARLMRTVSPSWSDQAASLHYEPIVTVYVQTDDRRLPSPMLALRSDSASPAQFVFDHGQISGRPGLMALVVSGASDWTAAGLPATGEAAVAQLRRDVLSRSCGDVEVLRVLSEKRATFLCEPLMTRPSAVVAVGLVCAGDYVDGPYPATLEGAVRSGISAARRIDAPR